MGIRKPWLRKICLPYIPSPESSTFLTQWSTLFDEQGDTLKELIESLSNQAQFQEVAEKILKGLNLDDETKETDDHDLEDENEEEEDSAAEQGENDEPLEPDSSADQDSHEGDERLMLMMAIWMKMQLWMKIKKLLLINLGWSL